jgi:proteasome lid subunit RPN8/RPN11
MEILHTVISDLKSYFRENSINSFEPVFIKEKATIEFELPVDSYVAPNIKERNFAFTLTCWVDNGMEINCKITTKRGSHVPFHPHFKKKWDWRTRGMYAEWIGYEWEETDLRMRIERMFLSLQFKPEYIKVEPESLIGNEKALLWFLKKQYKERYSNTDRSLAGSAHKKHFEVNTPQHQQGKKFDVSQGNTPSKKKFSIHQEIIFEPVAQPLPKYEVETSLNSLTGSLQSRSKIFITPTAREQIFSHIRWGNLHATETRSEQGGLLLGKVYFDKEAGYHYGMVERGIPGRSAQGSATYLEMTHETWIEMIENVDQVLSGEEHQDLQVIGWYHTHPNELDVFMSGTDQNTQRNHFNQDWHFAIVLNPQRRIWKAFSGAQALECSGFFLAAEEAATHYGDASRSGNKEERRFADPPPRKQYMGLKKVYLLLVLVVTLIIVVLAKFTSFTKQVKTSEPKQVKTKEQVTYDNKPKTKAVMPAATEYKPTETELKKGTTIYDAALEKLFEEPLTNPLKVTAQKRIDSMTNIEVQLFAYKDGVKVAEDSSLEISGNLRNANVVNSQTLVGELTHTITVSAGDYLKEGNWYKFKFMGVAKP